MYISTPKYSLQHLTKEVILFCKKTDKRYFAVVQIYLKVEDKFKRVEKAPQ